jgi:hypothetical protein
MSDRLKRKAEVDAAIIAAWGTASVTDIARQVGVTVWCASQIAARHGLGPTIKGSTAAPVLKPWPRPRGRSAEEIAWARENPDHPETHMILLMHEHPDPAAGRKDWS